MLSLNSSKKNIVAIIVFWEEVLSRMSYVLMKVMDISVSLRFHWLQFAASNMKHMLPQ